MSKKHDKKSIKKERSKKYEEKLSIDSTLDDVLKISVPKEPKDKAKEK